MGGGGGEWKNKLLSNFLFAAIIGLQFFFSGHVPCNFFFIVTFFWKGRGGGRGEGELKLGLYVFHYNNNFNVINIYSSKTIS